MSLAGSNRLMSIGRPFIPVDLPFADRLVRFKRTLLEMDDVSRFQYAVGASLLVHAIIIFGVGIRPPDLSKLDNSNPSLEVVLVNARSHTRPDKADAVAQHNLDGGGNTDADRRASSPLPVTRNDKQTTELTMEAQRVKQLEDEAKRLLTQMQSQAKVTTAQPQPDQQAEQKPALNAAELMSRSLEIARLEGQIAKDWDSYQKRPRRQFIGARTQEYRFAQYVEDWRIKIERIGTLNYPEAARNQRIYGSLQLTVAIRRDGSIDNIEINRSSGQKLLDESARRIVQLAAPYAAFPPDIAKDTDILSITRTWTFTREDQLTTR